MGVGGYEVQRGFSGKRGVRQLSQTRPFRHSLTSASVAVELVTIDARFATARFATAPLPTHPAPPPPPPPLFRQRWIGAGVARRLALRRAGASEWSIRLERCRRGDDGSRTPDAPPREKLQTADGPSTAAIAAATTGPRQNARMGVANDYNPAARTSGSPCVREPAGTGRSSRQAPLLCDRSAAEYKLKCVAPVIPPQP